MSYSKALRLFDEAIAEDFRENSRFDADGWGNFFLEDWKRDPDSVAEAWRLYNEFWSVREQHK